MWKHQGNRSQDKWTATINGHEAEVLYRRGEFTVSIDGTEVGGGAGPMTVLLPSMQEMAEEKASRNTEKV